MTASIEDDAARWDVEKWEATGPIPVITDAATEAAFDPVPPPGSDMRATYSPRQRGTFTPEQVAGIEARIRHYSLPWWRRWLAPRPPRWRG